MNDCDDLFSEKLDLLLKLRKETSVTWKGHFRPPLTGQGVYPRPHQNIMAIWLGVGGEPFSGPRHIWCNFVSSSKQKIEDVKKSWKDRSLPQITGEDDFIPLPES